MAYMRTPPLFELDCQAMHYDWGKPGKESLVAQLLLEQRIDSTLPYAELWIGIHPKGPSRVKFGDGALLSEVLKKNQKLLGPYTRKRWGTLPFLLKVLSIATPLSIQMHPDKSWAETLHEKDPDHYPDDNHKPEIALALSGVETLYGFENKRVLSRVWQQYPLLRSFSKTRKGSDSINVGEQEEEIALENLLPVLLTLPKNKGKPLLQKLYTQIQQEPHPDEKEQLFLSLYPRFAQDLGLLFLFFMEKLPIASQTALYLKTNQLHAYLSGDLVECMANSDNVIRAGITDKYKDIKAMLTRLSYHEEGPVLTAGISESNAITTYPTPAEEFVLENIQLPHNKSIHENKTKSPAILLTLSGKGTLASEQTKFSLQKGSVFFIGAHQTYSLSTPQQLHLVRATVPVP